MDFSNDLKYVSIHSGGHYNIKIKHLEHFSGGGAPGAPLMSSRVKKYCKCKFWLLIRITFCIALNFILFGMI